MAIDSDGTIIGGRSKSKGYTVEMSLPDYVYEALMKSTFEIMLKKDAFIPGKTTISPSEFIDMISNALMPNLIPQDVPQMAKVTITDVFDTTAEFLKTKVKEGKLWPDPDKVNTYFIYGDYWTPASYLSDELKPTMKDILLNEVRDMGADTTVSLSTLCDLMTARIYRDFEPLINRNAHGRTPEDTFSRQIRDLCDGVLKEHASEYLSYNGDDGTYYWIYDIGMCEGMWVHNRYTYQSTSQLPDPNTLKPGDVRWVRSSKGNAIKYRVRSEWDRIN